MEYRKIFIRLAAASTAVASLAALAACSSAPASGDAASTGSTDFDVVLGWYADPESGGIYAAQELGYYEDAGLNVSIAQGGPNVSGTQIVASGRAQVGMTDAGGILLAQQEGIPIVAISAVYQTNPVGVMVHADSGMTTFEDMADHTWVLQTGGVYGDYVKQSLGIDFDTQAYQGTIANFIADDSLVQQGWPTNEVYQAQQQGVETNFLPFASTGFNPYNDVMFATEDFIEEHPDELKAFLDATMRGWSDYIGDVDVATTTNAALLAANDEQTEESIWFAWDKQREYIVDGDGTDQLGAMTEERWNTLADQMVDLGVLDSGADASGAYDASFLPDVSAPTDLPAAPDGSY